MKFYAYKGHAALGEEPLGTNNKLLFELKTVRGAINRARVAFGNDDFSLFTYTNMYDNKTYHNIGEPETCWR